MRQFSNITNRLNSFQNIFNLSYKSRVIVKTVFVYWLVLISAFICNACDSHQNNSTASSAYNFEEARSRIRYFLESMNLPSISIAVAKDTSILWEESFGWADREKGIKVTPHTTYSLASISKPITATGLMVLVERGLVDLNQPVNTYLGEAKLRAFEGDVQDATVNRILHHTAGLPMHWHFFYEGDSYQRPTTDETIKRFGILVSPPGDRFEYSNLGYGIIEYIIERASKRSYPDFMKSEVFEPLGLKSTAVFIESPDENIVAQRYIENKDASPFYDFDHRGASAVYSSAHDLVRFGMFHLKNNLPDQQQILSDSTIDEMQTAVDPKLPDSHYKLGWDVGERYGYKVVSHGGGMTGVRTILLLLPSENIVVVVLCNGEYINLGQIYDPILAALLPDYKKQWKASRNSNTSRQSSDFSSSYYLVGEWIGKIITYQDTIPVQINFNKDGNVGMIFVSDPNSEKNIHEPISSPRFENGIFTANFDAESPIEEASRCRHTVSLKLKLNDNRLSGFAGAISFREFYCLPFYVEFSKK